MKLEAFVSATLCMGLVHWSTLRLNHSVNKFSACIRSIRCTSTSHIAKHNFLSSNFCCCSIHLPALCDRLHLSPSLAPILHSIPKLEKKRLVTFLAQVRGSNILVWKRRVCGHRTGKHRLYIFNVVRLGGRAIKCWDHGSRLSLVSGSDCYVIRTFINLLTIMYNVLQRK
jgi:hypothetical protein